jgi:hypothetical protein
MIYQRQFSLEHNKKVARAKDALRRLGANPKDALALMALYETCGRELQEVAVRHFGKNQLAEKAVLNLLVAVVSRAWTCDLQTTRAKEWIVQCADAEAKKLRVALDPTCRQGRRSGEDAGSKHRVPACRGLLCRE